MIDMVKLIVQHFAIAALSAIGSVACQHWQRWHNVDEKLLPKCLVMPGAGTRQYDKHIVQCWARRQGDAGCRQAKMTLALQYRDDC